MCCESRDRDSRSRGPWSNRFGGSTDAVPQDAVRLRTGAGRLVRGTAVHDRMCRCFERLHYVERIMSPQLATLENSWWQSKRGGVQRTYYEWFPRGVVHLDSLALHSKTCTLRSLSIRRGHAQGRTSGVTCGMALSLS